jgi:hypothetical protein
LSTSLLDVCGAFSVAAAGVAALRCPRRRYERAGVLRYRGEEIPRIETFQTL